MKVLYLSYDGMTDTLGQSQVLPYLVGLSKIGYQITIISAEKKENYLKRKNIINQIVKDNNIIWDPIFYTKKPPVFSTVYDIFKMRSKSKQLHLIHQFQIVHCRSYITSLIGLYLKRNFNIKFVFDMRGFWADERVDGNLWDLKNPIFKQVYQFFKRKEISFLQEADYTISLTENARNEIINNWNIENCSPIKIIPCCVDTILFDYNQFEFKKNNDKSLNIIYLGSLGTWYMLDEMLLLFKKIVCKYTFAHFNIVTPDDPQIVIKKAKEMSINIDSITVISAERNEVPFLLSKADISLFFIKPAYSKKSSSPTKMGEILSMGLPIIANSGVGDNDFLLEKYHYGYVLKDFSDQELTNCVEKILEIKKIDSKKLRNIALEYFNLDNGIDRYHEVYQSITK